MPINTATSYNKPKNKKRDKIMLLKAEELINEVQELLTGVEKAEVFDLLGAAKNPSHADTIIRTNNVPCTVSDKVNKILRQLHHISSSLN